MNHIEKIIEEVNSTMKMEKIPLIKKDKARLRSCVGDREKVDATVKDLVLKHTFSSEKLIGLSHDLIIHPGETLKEILEDKEMSQKELALRTSIEESHIIAIIEGKKPISISFVKKLECALGIDAQFWINLQSNYEKELINSSCKIKVINNGFK